MNAARSTRCSPTLKPKKPTSMPPAATPPHNSRARSHASTGWPPPRVTPRHRSRETGSPVPGERRTGPAGGRRPATAANTSYRDRRNPRYRTRPDSIQAGPIRPGAGSQPGWPPRTAAYRKPRPLKGFRHPGSGGNDQPRRSVTSCAASSNTTSRSTSSGFSRSAWRSKQIVASGSQGCSTAAPPTTTMPYRTVRGRFSVKSPVDIRGRVSVRANAE